MNSKYLFGLKVPTNEWYWKYNLSYDEAVEKLKYMGVDFIMGHNEYLPGSATAVAGSDVPEEYKTKINSYSEDMFREKLREANIGYVGQLHYGFKEKLMEKYGNYAVDQNGKRMEKVDWYIGVCPTCEEFNNEMVGYLEQAMQKYKMDGVFLGFMRFPGFWEMWLPGTDENAWPEYCFCDRCVSKFEKCKKIKVSPKKGETAGQWIRANCREEWIDFKCSVIYDIVKRFHDVVKKYNKDGKVILNTIPFDKKHFGDNGKTLFGQDPRRLAEVVEIFEVMGYNQILNLPTKWLGEVGEYFKKETNGAHVCVTAQGQPLYTEGMHAGKGRAETVTSDDFKSALQSVKDSEADGAVVFTWSDFLHKEYDEHDGTMVKIVHELFGE